MKSMLNRIAMRAGSSKMTSFATGVRRTAGPRGTTNYQSTRGGSRFMSHDKVARRGYGVMGGSAAGYVGLNRKASGSQGAPPTRSSGGHMLY